MSSLLMMYQGLRVISVPDKVVYSEESNLDPKLFALIIQKLTTKDKYNQKLQQAMRHSLTCDNPSHLSCQGIVYTEWDEPSKST